jgi:hypothetical protein
VVLPVPCGDGRTGRLLPEQLLAGAARDGVFCPFDSRGRLRLWQLTAKAGSGCGSSVTLHVGPTEGGGDQVARSSDTRLRHTVKRLDGGSAELGWQEGGGKHLWRRLQGDGSC